VTHIEREGELQRINDLPKGISEYCPLFSWKGNGWAFESEQFELVGTLEMLEDLFRAIADAGFNTASLAESVEKLPSFDSILVLLVARQAKTIQAYSISGEDPRKLFRHAWLISSVAGARQPAGTEGLKEARVGIVGLGSVGSKVAISLARSGITDFLLVDDDIMLGENVARNELTWSSVGTHKVSAVSEALRLIGPNIKVDVRQSRIGGQESAVTAAGVLNALAKCDIVLDATARPEGFLTLAAISKSARKPLVWCEVFAGGYGGFIARARPEMDPNPYAVRDALHEYLSGLPQAPFKAAVDYDDTVGVALAAFDSDVGLSLTRF
jgi:molybdopterin/thiamine biosynthesis adenylyltransferase